MKLQSEKLITELIGITEENLNFAYQLKTKSEDELNKRISERSWSALECIEHLNLYGYFYIPEIENRIKKSKINSEPEFKSGLLGNYFANAMLPKERLNKMKTFSNMNPINSSLNKHTLEVFITQQKELINLLNKAKKISLNKTKTSISISKLIKLKLGDTFRFVIYHNKRHILQAQNVIKNTKIN